MARSFAMMLGSLILVGVMLFALVRHDRQIQSSERLLVYCAATHREAMDEVRRDYENKTGRVVDLQYGPSQTLLSNLVLSRQGDLYIPADSLFLQLAEQQALIREQCLLASMETVVLVQSGNPQSITSFHDLLREDVRLVLANDESAAIGRRLRTSLSSKQWMSLRNAARGLRGTVTEAANDVAIGAADATIVYDVVGRRYATLEVLRLEELAKIRSDVAAGVLRWTRNPEGCQTFLRYLGEPHSGWSVLNKHGFSGPHPVSSDDV